MHLILQQVWSKTNKEEISSKNKEKQGKISADLNILQPSLVARISKSAW